MTSGSAWDSRFAAERHASYDVSFTLAMAAFHLWMVGGRYLTKDGGGSYVSSSGVLLNVALLTGLLSALFVIDRLELRGRVPAQPLAGACLFVAIVGSLSVWQLQTESRMLLPVRARAAVRGMRTNVVLITVDTLRADRVSTHGYSRKTAPHLDRLAATSLVFHRAVSPSTWTFPCHLAIFTGKLPRRLGLGADGNAQYRSRRASDASARTDDPLVAHYPPLS